MNRFVGKSIQVDNSPQNLASSTLNKRYLLTEYGVDTVSFKSGVRPTSHDNPTNIELDYHCACLLVNPLSSFKFLKERAGIFANI